MISRTDIYVDRLFNEWVRHGKIIISVDYDSTLLPNETIDNESDIARVISILKIAKETGAYVVVFTTSKEDRFPSIRDYCNRIGLNIDSINENPIELPYGGDGYRKIFYNINLCDRSGLLESLDILEIAMYKYRSYKQTRINLDDVA
jgi:hypothetical protein